MAGDLDFFGYQRANPGKFLYSSDYAALMFANTPGGTATTAQRAGLVQQVALSYQQNVQPRFESGSHEIFWVTGQSMGSLQVGRIVADKGLLDGVRSVNGPNDLRKGLLGGVEIKVGRLNTVGVAVKQEVLMLSGCVIGSYGLSFGTGGLEISESVTIHTALVKRGLVVR